MMNRVKVKGVEGNPTTLLRSRFSRRLHRSNPGLSPTLMLGITIQISSPKAEAELPKLNLPAGLVKCFYLPGLH